MPSILVTTKIPSSVAAILKSVGDVEMPSAPLDRGAVLPQGRDGAVRHFVRDSFIKARLDDQHTDGFFGGHSAYLL